MTVATLENVPRPLVLEGVALPVVGRFRAYICGITPYDVTHLGHVSTYLWTDTAIRVLQSTGTPVHVTRNITDIDEALLAEAARRGVAYDYLALTERFAFDRTMTALRVRPPDAEPTASTTVAQVVQLGQALLTRGAAYLREGNVYARTSDGVVASDRDGRLLAAGEYGDDPTDPLKDDPLDTAVWRAEATDGVCWPSPWGPGRPGWHAECAAMVLAAYGSGVDLHCGGQDLAVPHHVCETWMGEHATGVTPFARAWLRPGTVMIDGVKMAKSTKNLVLADDLIERSSVDAVRLLCLNRSWQQPWTYTETELARAQQSLASLRAAAARPGTGGGPAEEIDRLMLSGLDVPAALDVALEAGGDAARRLAHLLKVA